MIEFTLAPLAILGEGNVCILEKGKRIIFIPGTATTTFIKKKLFVVLCGFNPWSNLNFN